MSKHPLASFAYCPRCGSPLFEAAGAKAKRCKACGFEYFFNPAAATVALIINEREELLVCRRAKEPQRGMLDLPGGFADCYETAEEGVAREVMEETGLKVIRTTYLFSLPNIYPYSGFDVHTLDLFFRCDVETSAHILARDDVSDTFFIPLSQIHPEEFGLASIRRGLEKFLDVL
jgi:ADP-ribose pyrophosphatase YjhB (NUDIX family)